MSGFGSSSLLYECEDCGLKSLEFPPQNDLSTRRSKCFLCFGNFHLRDSNLDLEAHQTIDQDSDLFSCNICNSYFAQIGLLTSHFENSHFIIYPNKKPQVVPNKADANVLAIGQGGQDSIEYPVQVREPTRITARHDLPPADDIYRANSSRHDPLVIDYNAQNQSNRKDPVIIDYNSQNQSNRPYEGYGDWERNENIGNARQFDQHLPNNSNFDQRQNEIFQSRQVEQFENNLSRTAAVGMVRISETFTRTSIQIAPSNHPIQFGNAGPPIQGMQQEPFGNTGLVQSRQLAPFVNTGQIQSRPQEQLGNVGHQEPFGNMGPTSQVSQRESYEPTRDQFRLQNLVLSGSNQNSSGFNSQNLHEQMRPTNAIIDRQQDDFRHSRDSFGIGQDNFGPNQIRQHSFKPVHSTLPDSFDMQSNMSGQDPGNSTWQKGNALPTVDVQASNFNQATKEQTTSLFDSAKQRLQRMKDNLATKKQAPLTTPSSTAAPVKDHSLKCTQCPKLFTDKFHLDKHFNSFHAVEQEKDPFACGCDMDSFIELFQLNCSDEEKQSIHSDLYHLNLEQNVTPFRCGLCCALFVQVIYLDKHTRDEEHQSSMDVTKLYVCNTCDADFTNKEQLVSHFKFGHNKINKTHESGPALTPARLASTTTSTPGNVGSKSTFVSTPIIVNKPPPNLGDNQQSATNTSQLVKTLTITSKPWLHTPSSNTNQQSATVTSQVETSMTITRKPLLNTPSLENQQSARTVTQSSAAPTGIANKAAASFVSTNSTVVSAANQSPVVMVQAQPKNFLCPDCSFKFSDEKAFERHFSFVHKGKNASQAATPTTPTMIATSTSKSNSNPIATLVPIAKSPATNSTLASKTSAPNVAMPTRLASESNTKALSFENKNEPTVTNTSQSMSERLSSELASTNQVTKLTEQCETPPKVLPTQSVTFTQKVIFHCPDCSFKFSNEKLFERHVIVIHKKSYNQDANVIQAATPITSSNLTPTVPSTPAPTSTPTTFENSASNNSAKTTPLNPELFCSECSENFQFKYLFARHLNEHHPSKGQQLLVKDQFQADPFDIQNNSATLFGTNSCMSQASPSQTSTNSIQAPPVVRQPDVRHQSNQESAQTQVGGPSPHQSNKSATPVKAYDNPMDSQANDNQSSKDDGSSYLDPLPSREHLRKFPCLHCLLKFEKKINLIKHEKNAHGIDPSTYGGRDTEQSNTLVSRQSNEEETKVETVLTIAPYKMPVSLLQELASIRGLFPEYTILEADPTGQNPMFKYSVTLVKLIVNGLVCNSKKKAKHSAAMEMLLFLKKIPESTNFGKFKGEFPEDLVCLAEDASTLDLSDVERLHGSTGVISGQAERLAAAIKDPEFNCNFCPTKTKIRERLLLHHDEMHLNKDPNSMPFKCGLCMNSFNQIKPLETHCSLDGHQALTKFCKLYVCSLCKCFAEDDKLNLIQHFKTQHSNMMAYPPALPDPVSVQQVAATNSEADFLIQAKKFADLFFKRISIQTPEKTVELITSAQEFFVAKQILDYLSKAIDSKSSKWSRKNLSPTAVGLQAIGPRVVGLQAIGPRVVGLQAKNPLPAKANIKTTPALNLTNEPVNSNLVGLGSRKRPLVSNQSTSFQGQQSTPENSSMANKLGSLANYDVSQPGQPNRIIDNQNSKPVRERLGFRNNSEDNSRKLSNPRKEVFPEIRVNRPVEFNSAQNVPPQNPRLGNISIGFNKEQKPPARSLLGSSQPPTQLLASNQPQRPILASSQPQRPFLASSQPQRPLLASNQPQRPLLASNEPPRPLLASNQPPRPSLATNQPPRPPLASDQPPKPVNVKPLPSLMSIGLNLGKSSNNHPNPGTTGPNPNQGNVLTANNAPSAQTRIRFGQKPPPPPSNSIQRHDQTDLVNRAQEPNQPLTKNQQSSYNSRPDNRQQQPNSTVESNNTQRPNQTRVEVMPQQSHITNLLAQPNCWKDQIENLMSGNIQSKPDRLTGNSVLPPRPPQPQGSNTGPQRRTILPNPPLPTTPWRPPEGPPIKKSRFQWNRQEKPSQ